MTVGNSLASVVVVNWTLLDVLVTDDFRGFSDVSIIGLVAGTFVVLFVAVVSSLVGAFEGDVKRNSDNPPYVDSKCIVDVDCIADEASVEA